MVPIDHAIHVINYKSRLCTARPPDRRPAGDPRLRGRTARRGDSQDASTARPSRTVALLSDSNGGLPLRQGSCPT